VHLGANEILQMAGRVHGRVEGGRVFILSDRAIDFATLRPTPPDFQLAGDSERVALTCADLGVRADELELPVPLDRIPVVIGGTGPRTIELVARHATWWNVPVHRLDRLDDLRGAVGGARPSVQQMVAFVADESERAAVTEAARRRFAHFGAGLVIGNAEEVAAHLAGLEARGVERIYLWFTDFARPETLAAFGDQVIAPLAH
jgi:alkanesulfonate monooxygenase SsuD/methylene tetrahydromethanopterin reductase-like flavin-dependent oxidoreductase (luciferase family)